MELQEVFKALIDSGGAIAVVIALVWLAPHIIKYLTSVTSSNDSRWEDLMDVWREQLTVNTQTLKELSTHFETFVTKSMEDKQGAAEATTELITFIDARLTASEVRIEGYLKNYKDQESIKSD